jgi:hypothetical protein
MKAGQASGNKYRVLKKQMLKKFSICFFLSTEHFWNMGLCITNKSGLKPGLFE